MRFSQYPSDGNSIKAYRPGEITINDRKITSSAVITPDTVTAWTPRCLDEITPQHIGQLADYQPEIVILGTGEHLRFPQAAIITSLQTRGIGVEVMNTEAACRTFNVLLSEGRRVVAAIILG